MKTSRVGLAAILVLVGCGPDVDPMCSGGGYACLLARDGFAPDVGEADAAGELPDLGAPDVGEADAAGELPDLGAPDVGEADAAGELPDLGPLPPWVATVEAESAGAAHDTGHAEPGGWAGLPGVEPRGMLLHGAAVQGPAASLEIGFRVAGLDIGDPAAVVGRVEVYDDEAMIVLLSQPLRNADVVAGELLVRVESSGHRLQARVFWNAATYLFVDRVTYREISAP